MIACSRCGKKSDGTAWKCECGGPLEVVDIPRFQREKLRESHSLWRYQPYLGTECRVSYSEGWTPVVFIENHYYKLDFLFPTGSFKDRGSTVMMSDLAGKTVSEIVEDSSGNAGASIAAYAARAGITAEIFVPEYASGGKISQIEAFGARICKVKGTREDTRLKAVERAEKIYYASHQWNPYFLEGMKTIAYELSEQFNWNIPDVVIPVGSGSLYYGIVKGFCHLRNSGIIEKIPQLIGVQPEVCCPVYCELHKIEQVYRKSIAEGLLIEHPPRLKELVRAVGKYGDIITVSEEEIVKGLKKGLKKGLYIEPTSAVVIAALDKLHSSEPSVGLLTGTGLKAPAEIKSLYHRFR